MDGRLLPSGFMLAFEWTLESELKKKSGYEPISNSGGQVNYFFSNSTGRPEKYPKVHNQENVSHNSLVTACILRVIESYNRVERHTISCNDSRQCSL